MNVFFVIILSRICVSFVQTGISLESPPHVLCNYVGSAVDFESPPFEIADVPDRCAGVLYGVYNLNEKPSGSDEVAIKALISAGKTVYMLYNCPDSNEWSVVIDDPKVLETSIAPMLAYLKENNKIGGVILSNLNAFEGTIPDYATKINAMICKIKEVGSSLKIGLVIEGDDSPKYKSKTEFDLTVTNDFVDFYIIDLWIIQVLCKPNLAACGGRSPINSSSPDVMSLEKLSKNIDSSKVNKSKLLVNVVDGADLLDSSGTFSNVYSYSKYCSRPSGTKDIWCVDSTKIIYDQITYLKTIFKGIMITYMESDDPTNTCGCGKFPVANTQIDALEGKPMKSCKKIG